MGKDDQFDISIRRALVTDAKALGVVGPAAYAQAYEYLWGDPAALAAHLESFSVDAFAILFAQADIAVREAEQRGKAVGYLTLHLWLDVMTAAARVQEIYRSWCFTAIGTSMFEHGVRPELAGLVIMGRPLGPSLTGSAEKGVR